MMERGKEAQPGTGRVDVLSAQASYYSETGVQENLKLQACTALPLPNFLSAPNLKSKWFWKSKEGIASQ